uniref:Uncharacterized protein n=1 Tax=Utricularia reniformis TaxID=192314 RepID=A0A1Y0AZS2_9LAMI|nr:hypothetical protein AEK19_MT0408 [Utricularia reniformis]ART30675.1 hypothetical protein AEK19_MT0408 [Utricularia reniformis]
MSANLLPLAPLLGSVFHDVSQVIPRGMVETHGMYLFMRPGRAWDNIDTISSTDCSQDSLKGVTDAGDVEVGKT